MDGESRSHLFYRHVAVGEVSAVVASAVTYPLDVAKTVAQAGVAQASVAHAVVAQTGAVQGSTIAGGSGGGSSGGMARSGTAAASRAAAISGLNWRSRAAFTGFSPHLAGHLPSLAARYTTYHLASAYQMAGVTESLLSTPTFCCFSRTHSYSPPSFFSPFPSLLRSSDGLPSWLLISPPQAGAAGAIAGATESLLSAPRLFVADFPRTLSYSPFPSPSPPPEQPRWSAVLAAYLPASSSISRRHSRGDRVPALHTIRPPQNPLAARHSPAATSSSSLGTPSPSHTSPGHTSPSQSSTVKQSSIPSHKSRSGSSLPKQRLPHPLTHRPTNSRTDRSDRPHRTTHKRTFVSSSPPPPPTPLSSTHPLHPRYLSASLHTPPIPPPSTPLPPTTFSLSLARYPWTPVPSPYLPASSPWEAARAGVRAEGAAQLWRGLRAGVTRDSLFGAVFFGGWGLEAAVAAAVASVVSHPFDCAKTRTQATVLPKHVAMELALAQGLSGSASDLAHLLEVLRGAEDALAKHAPQLDTLLASLDPALHSLAFLFFLDAHAAQAPGQLWEQVVGTIINFIKVASPTQIALAPEKFASLCHRLRDLLISHSQYSRGVLPLRWAISKVQQCTTAEHLTPQHADCLQLCLLAKLYRQGGELLQRDILDIDPKKTGLVHRDFLLYCFYGGTIYVGLKQYQKALDLFMHAITSPAQGVNAITVAAYKRHVLVSLILNAQLSPLPKFTPGIVQRGLKACCQDYHDLANIYVSRDAAELKKFVDSHEQAFKADNNLGLAHQVVASVPKRSIQRLTHTYLTLSLSDLAQSVHLSSPAEAEKYLLSMIADGEMFARIDQQAGMVSFEEDPEKYDSLAMAAVVEEHIQRATKLSKKLALVHEQISSDRTYLTRVNARERNVRYGEHEDYELAPQRMFDTIELSYQPGKMLPRGAAIVPVAIVSICAVALLILHGQPLLSHLLGDNGPMKKHIDTAKGHLVVAMVCEQVIDSCCNLIWPRSRLYIQILDDSTCPITRSRVVKKVAEKVALGIHVEDRWRSNRQGYKAGAMMEAEKAIGDYEFTAIFDADFSPEPEFLLKTIPYLISVAILLLQERLEYGGSLQSRMQAVGTTGRLLRTWISLFELTLEAGSSYS
ncbi:unnamed protein product [Closterium sp. Naga37s-1]|nr:unnamed protein product [Closterium sp. Naga37s-1]